MNASRNRPAGSLRSVTFTAGRVIRDVRSRRVDHMATVIAIVEDDEPRRDAMQAEIKTRLPGVETIFFDNAPDMLAWLKANPRVARLLCLDHDLGPDRQRGDQAFDPGIGRDVADFLATQEPCCPVLIHSSNTQGACGMQFALEDAGWSVKRLAPFDDLAWVGEQWIGRVQTLVGAI